jgi:hypothetical protein
MKDALSEARAEVLELRQKMLTHQSLESEKTALASQVRLLASDLEKSALILKTKDQEIEHKRQQLVETEHAHMQTVQKLKEEA